MKVGFAVVIALLGLAVATPGPAQAGPPVPWCGPGPSAADRGPDATLGFAVHVLYVRPPGAPDRFAEWAPRLAGDAAEIEGWWRSQDPARSPRFDLFALPGCAGSFGALDLTSLQLSRGVTSIDDAFGDVRELLTDVGFREAEKAYLVYYDGPTGQFGDDHVCGQGAPASGGRSGIAVVYLDACRADEGDTVRAVIAVHELMHVFGAVSRTAPHHCQSGHVCDATSDLMAAVLSPAPLTSHVLDVARDDYYGHAGRWTDVQDSFFLERLDGNDRAAPTTPATLRIGDTPAGLTQVSWGVSRDDVGPILYRVYADGDLIDETSRTSMLLSNGSGTTRFSVRALDAVGHVSLPVSARFRTGAGMIDAAGRLLRDTVRPPAVARVAIRRTRTTAVLTWPAVRDSGGVASYRVRVGSQTVVVRKPAVALARARVTGNVSIVAVDRAGNVGRALVVPRSRVQ